jgi:hypothetical protein
VLTSTLFGNEVIGIEAERVSDISEIVGQEATIIPAINTTQCMLCACGDFYVHFL